MSEEKTKLKAITTNEVEAPRPSSSGKRLPALTSNKIEPMLPSYPKPENRRPAKGPMITTGNIEEFRARGEAPDLTAPPATDPKPEKKTRAKKA